MTMYEIVMLFVLAVTGYVWMDMQSRIFIALLWEELAKEEAKDAESK